MRACTQTRVHPHITPQPATHTHTPSSHTHHTPTSYTHHPHPRTLWELPEMASCDPASGPPHQSPDWRAQPAPACLLLGSNPALASQHSARNLPAPTTPPHTAPCTFLPLHTLGWREQSSRHTRTPHASLTLGKLHPSLALMPQKIQDLSKRHHNLNLTCNSSQFSNGVINAANLNFLHNEVASWFATKEIILQGRWRQRLFQAAGNTTEPADGAQLITC